MADQTKKTEEEIEWQWFPLPFNPFFDVYKKYTNLLWDGIIKRYIDTRDKDGKEINKLQVKHKDGYEYKILFDRQDDVVCGIEIYRRLLKK